MLRRRVDPVADATAAGTGTNRLEEGAAATLAGPDPSDSAPFTKAAIARIFSAWEALPRVLLAVSGGPDSVALMLLAAEWARARGSAPDLRVATVDHGLRPRSREEAETVARWARARGLTPEILVWEGAKPKTRIQERAREKRYELLFAHAKQIGAAAVATAHHADDQVETILFRLLRGSGLRGLAGMAAETDRGGCLHSRPLLPYRKEDLVGYCRAEGQIFFEDPSNRDPAFARTRIRDLVPRLAAEGLDRDTLLRLGRRAARAESALAALARDLFADLEARRDSAGIVADARPMAAWPDELLLRVLEIEIKGLADRRDLRLDRLERLAEKFATALRSRTPFRASLGGCLVELRGDGRLAIRREERRGQGN